MSDDRERGGRKPGLDIFESLGKKPASPAPGDATTTTADPSGPPPPVAAATLLSGSGSGSGSSGAPGAPGAFSDAGEPIAPPAPRFDAKKTLLGIPGPAIATSVPKRPRPAPSRPREEVAPPTVAVPPPPPPGRDELPSVKPTPAAEAAPSGELAAETRKVPSAPASPVPPADITRPTGPSDLAAMAGPPSSSKGMPAAQRIAQIDGEWDDAAETHVFDKERREIALAKALDDLDATEDNRTTNARPAAGVPVSPDSSAQMLEAPQSNRPERASLDAILSGARASSEMPAAAPIGSAPPPPAPPKPTSNPPPGGSLVSAFGALGQPRDRSNGSVGKLRSSPPSQPMRAAPAAAPPPLPGPAATPPPPPMPSPMVPPGPRIRKATNPMGPARTPAPPPPESPLHTPPPPAGGLHNFGAKPPPASGSELERLSSDRFPTAQAAPFVMPETPRPPREVSGPPPQVSGPPPREISGPPPREVSGPPPHVSGAPPREVSGPPPHVSASPREVSGPPPREVSGPPPRAAIATPIPPSAPPEPAAAQPIPRLSPEARHRPRMAQTARVPREEGSRTPIIAAVLAAVMLGAGLLVFFLMPRSGTLAVNVADAKGVAIPRLEVHVDGAKRCDSAPCIVRDVSSGIHEVKVTAPGFESPAPRAVTISRGDAQVDFQLVAKAQSKTGLKITGPTGVKVWLDGKELGAPPQELREIEPGEHKLKAQGDRYAPFEKTITVTKDELSDIPLVMKVLKGKVLLQPGTPGAKVYLVNGANRKEVPQLPMAIEFDPNDKWELLATKEGFDDLKEPISFEDGVAEKTFTITLPAKGTAPTPSHAAPPASPPPTPTNATAPPATPKPREPRDPAPKPDDGKPEPAPTASAAPGPAAPTLGPNEGILKINSLPGASVVLDGKTIGNTPQAPVVQAGSHTITFINAEQSLKKTITVEVKPGETKPAFTKLRD